MKDLKELIEVLKEIADTLDSIRIVLKNMYLDSH